MSSRLGDRLNGQLSNTVFQVCDEPPQIATCGSKRALTYAFYREKMKGKTSKNAPTYLAREKQKKEAGESRSQAMRRHVCDACGYVYDPAAGDRENDIPAGRALEDFPDDWVFPVCGVGKGKFSREG